MWALRDGIPGVAFKIRAVAILLVRARLLVRRGGHPCADARLARRGARNAVSRALIPRGARDPCPGACVAHNGSDHRMTHPGPHLHPTPAVRSTAHAQAPALLHKAAVPVGAARPADVPATGARPATTRTCMADPCAAPARKPPCRSMPTAATAAPCSCTPMRASVGPVASIRRLPLRSPHTQSRRPSRRAGHSHI